MDTCGEQLKSEIKMSVFGGVEGGATHSTLVLFNEKSEALTTVEGPGTNLFLNGMDETCHRIAEMICQALKNLGKFHGLRTPNEGINQRYLKNWADVADEMCFGRT